MTEFSAVLSQVKQKTSDFSEKLRELEAEHQKEMQSLFDAVTKDFFVEWPEIGCIHWVQYTPFWNDGDECHFNVHEITYDRNLEFNGRVPRDDEEDVDDYDWGGIPFKKFEKYVEYEPEELILESKEYPRLDAAHNAVTGLINVINSIDSDTMKSLFGDHVSVVIDKDGVHTDEHEHE